MAYRNPAFYFAHAARTAGIGAISINNGAAAADSPLDLLIDDRSGANFQYAADPVTASFIEVDRGVDFATLPTLDTWIIPAGNNFGEGGIVTLEAEEDDNAGFSSPTSLHAPLAISEGDTALQFQAFATTSTQRFIRLQNNIAISTRALAWGELFFTQKRELTRGPDPEWDHPFVTNVFVSRSDAGVISTRVQGAAVQTFRMVFRNVSGADMQIFIDLFEAVGHDARPFYFDPPDDTLPTMLVRLIDAAGLQQDFLNPGLDLSDRVTLELEELLG